MDVNGPEDGLYSRPAVIGKTEMAVFAQNDMIQQRDTEELSALAESLREDAIFLARGRVAGWVVIGTNESGRIHQDQRLKDFARMDNRQGQRTDRHDINANDAVFGIQSADEELLSIQPFKARPEQARGANRGLNGFGWREAG